jgi:hypothetical protein
MGLDLKHLETETHKIKLRIWDLPNEEKLKGSTSQRTNLWKGIALHLTLLRS